MAVQAPGKELLWVLLRRALGKFAEQHFEISRWGSG